MVEEQLLAQLNFLAADSEVATLMRTHDWSTSPLGPPSGWPQSLQTVVSLMLRSKTPKFAVWGNELCMLYNDAYLEILGIKHPAALGRPLPEIWSEVWAEVQPLFGRALTGEPLHFENMEFKICRKEVEETAWISFSYTPLYEANTVCGVFCDLKETTNKVLAERRRADEAKRLKQLFEQSPGMIAVVRGPDHIFETANANYVRFVGDRPLIGRPAREALPELESQGLMDLLDQVFNSGEPYKGDAVPVLIQQAPGALLEERLVNFVYQPIFDDKGEVTGIFAEGFDVTDMVGAAMALQESELRLRQLANTIPQLAWMADATGAIHWYNDRWFEYTGKTPAEMEGWGWQAVHDPEELPKVLERWQYSLTSGEPFEMSFPLRAKDGKFRPFFTLVAPLRDSAGQIVQWFGTNTDVSSLHRAQEELHKTQEWLKDGLLAGRMVVWEWDLETQAIKFSDNSIQVLGISSGVADEIWSGIYPEDTQGLTDAIDNALTTGTQFKELTRRIRPDTGELIWAEVQGRVVTNVRGERVCMRGIMIDVTERIKAERDLKEASRRKDEFLAMLAHELRNPLAPISTAAQLLKLAGSDEQRVRQSSDIISRQVKHMTDLVDDLLDVSRVTRGLVELQSDNVDLKSIVASAIEQARPLIEARNHALTTHMTSAQAFVHGDRTRLIQVVTNLLNNAAKYTPPGGQIGLVIEVEDGQTKIKISDNGIGIEPSLLPHVFELFTQAERTPDRSQGGLGLGLALAKSIIVAHGGHVEGFSAGLGNGGLFSVVLPRSTNGASAAVSSSESLPSGALVGIHIMVVDDNVDAAESLGALLEAHGHHVTVKTDPLSALAEASQLSPDVFILDIGLPDMDGYELAKRLKASPNTAKARFIALTGYGQPHDRVLSKTAGFDHHFVKPISSSELINLLNSQSYS